MTTPSRPARFGHRAAPRALILIRVCNGSRCSDGRAGDRGEPRAIAVLIYSAGAENVGSCPSCLLLPTISLPAVPVLALRRGRVFAGGLPVRRGAPVTPLPHRRGARGFDRGQQRGVDFRHPPEPGHAPGNRDKSILLIR